MRIDALFVEQCLERAGRQDSSLSAEAIAVPGMTSPEVRALLNNLCSQGADYCEIGTLMGATAVAASYANTGRFVAVDSFSQWPTIDEGGAFAHMDRTVERLKGRRTREVWHEHIRSLGCQVELIEQDCFIWEPDFTVDILFYDGDHSAEATYRALTELRCRLAPRLVIVDDYHGPTVQAGVKRAGMAVAQEWTRPWWNGIYLALVG